MSAVWSDLQRLAMLFETACLAAAPTKEAAFLQRIFSGLQRQNIQYVGKLRDITMPAW